MRRYETIFISDPDLSGDDQAQLFEKITDLIAKKGGVIVDFDEWGSRRLAYEIKKKQRGYYVRLDYCGDGEVVKALENAFRLDERVLKFMTIFLQDGADPEELKKALAQEKTQTGEDADKPDETSGDKKPETESAGDGETDSDAGVDAGEDGTTDAAKETKAAVIDEKTDAASADNK